MSSYIAASLAVLLIGPAAFAHAMVATSHFITGANGYLGRAIVHELIHQQFASSSPPLETTTVESNNGREEEDDTTIVCLVRLPRVKEEQAYWNKFSNNSRQHASRSSASRKSCNIRVRPYDMLDGGESIMAALLEYNNANNHYCIYHVASVFGPTADPVQTALDNVRGTTDLLETVARAILPTNKNAMSGRNCMIILTSSMAAVRASGQTPSNGQFYTAKDWNTESKLDAANNWGTCYQWSKAESERRAWQLSKELKLPMVSLCPSFVFGPCDNAPNTATTTSSSSSFSLELVDQWVRGLSPVQSRLLVDVRDVARAHVMAGRLPQAAVGQRYIVSHEARVSSGEIADWLRFVCQTTGLSDPDLIHFDADFQGGAIPIGSKEVEAVARLKKELGVSIRPAKETIMEMACALLQKDTARL
jgi:nucleoside-diphosphate-sugar epimerase